jgi:hypothetical protein
MKRECVAAVNLVLTTGLNAMQTDLDIVSSAINRFVADLIEVISQLMSTVLVSRAVGI